MGRLGFYLPFHYFTISLFHHFTASLLPRIRIVENASTRAPHKAILSPILTQTHPGHV
jgi:hypothetical protein